MDERGALTSDLMQKRDRLQAQAQRHREARDKLNDETKRHSAKRDEFNAQVRAIVDRANAHKAKRDELNAKVHEAKSKRDELNVTAHEKTEALAAMRKEKGGGPAQSSGIPIPKLRAEIQHLEYQQQTTVLTPKKEKELIDLIGTKLRELKEREAAYEEHADVKKAWEDMKTAKAAAEEQHHAVTLLANEAQGEHDSMVKLYHEADGVRKLADAEQGEFVKHKIEADRTHHEFVEAISAIRDIERVAGALRGTTPRGEREGPQSSDQAAAQSVAEGIFDKFRKGEKLSTEDLMALQKAGRL
ncbi:MAG: phosphoserine phosphatase [Candidatus Thermoplasmatota archaeon]